MFLAGGRKIADSVCSADVDSHILFITHFMLASIRSCFEFPLHILSCMFKSELEDTARQLITLVSTASVVFASQSDSQD